MSAPEEATSTQLCRDITEQIIPSVSNVEESWLILAERTLRVPSGIAVRRRAVAPLQAQQSQSRMFMSQWKQESMHAIRYPYFCCVLEGEVDIRLAFPAPQGQARQKGNAYQILTLPPQTVLVIPPGVLYPDGTQPHWERPAKPVADSRLFWILFLPTGVFCHTCSTTQSAHECQDDVFVPDLQLATLAEMMMEELRAPAADVRLAAQNLLMLILLRVRRGLAGQALQKAPAPQARGKKITVYATPNSLHLQRRDKHASGDDAVLGVKSAIVERACGYIRAHLNQPFGIKDIADYVYVSPSHLARLFRAERGMTLMKYVLQQRMEYASSMLANTELAIQEIARSVGYIHAPQFNRVFRKERGMTPGEFRQQHRS